LKPIWISNTSYKIYAYFCGKLFETFTTCQGQEAGDAHVQAAPCQEIQGNCHLFNSPIMKLPFFIHLSRNCHFLFTSHEIVIFYSPLMKLPFFFTSHDIAIFFTSHEIATFYSPPMKLPFFIHLS
jgi:hypothetical protein